MGIYPINCEESRMGVAIKKLVFILKTDFKDKIQLLIILT